MAIAALIIALFAAAFTGYHVYLAFKEQKHRLRPYVYVDRVDTDISDEALTFRIAMTNCGLLPARQTTLSNVVKLNGQIIEKKPELTLTKHAIVLPNQIVRNSIRIAEPTRSKILQGTIRLTDEIEIRYKSNRESYYFKVNYVFNLQEKGFTMIEGDAN